MARPSQRSAAHPSASRKTRKIRPVTESEQAFRTALGQTIRRLRQDRYSQDEFADRVDVYRSHMGRIEQGQMDLRLSTLRRIAAALHLTPASLLSRVQRRAGKTTNDSQTD